MKTGRKPIHGNRTRTFRSREYVAWDHMKARCYNPKNNKYPDYGGRGITVCEGWKNSFQTFLKDMGPNLPLNTHLIEKRIAAITNQLIADGQLIQSKPTIGENEKQTEAK